MVKDILKGFAYALGRIIAFILIGLLITFLISKIDTKKIPLNQLIMKSMFVNAYASEQFVGINQTDLWGTFKGGGSNATVQNSISMSGNGNENSPYNVSSFNNTGVPFDYYEYIRVGLGVLYNPLNGDVTYREVVTLYFDDVFWNPASVSFSPVMYNGNNMTSSLTDMRFSNCTSTAGVSFCSHYEFDMVYTWKGASVVELWLYSNGNYRMSPSSKISYRNWSFTGTTDNSDIIVNQNNTIINQNNQINNSINNVSNTINSIFGDTEISGDSVASDFADIDSISDTPVSDLITLPLVLIRQLYNSMNSSCSSYTLPFGFGLTDFSLTFPCVDLGHEKYFGRVVWGYIDDLMCIFMILNIFKMVVWFWSHWTSLKDNFEWFYDPSTKGVIL